MHKCKPGSARSKVAHGRLIKKKVGELFLYCCSIYLHLIMKQLKYRVHEYTESYHRTVVYYGFEGQVMEKLTRIMKVTQCCMHETLLA